MKLFCSQTRAPTEKGVVYANPRHFSGPIEGVKTVYLDGDWPEIALAYKEAGAEVIRIDPQTITAPIAEVPHVAREAIVIPEDWRDLPWPDLRALASAIAQGTVVNKAEAVAIIETELKRRG